jgi:subtilase family serine protease
MRDFSFRERLPSLTVVALIIFCFGSGVALERQPIWAGFPDLVISSLSAELTSPDTVSYSYTITNVGTEPANLDGPTGNNADNVSVQAFISKDTIFQNQDDLAAGGTILDVSPLGLLHPGESRSDSFSATITGDVMIYPYLVLMVDWGRVVRESNENNNTAAVGIAHPDPSKPFP